MSYTTTRKRKVDPGGCARAHRYVRNTVELLRWNGEGWQKVRGPEAWWHRRNWERQQRLAERSAWHQYLWGIKCRRCDR